MTQTLPPKKIIAFCVLAGFLSLGFHAHAQVQLISLQYGSADIANSGDTAGEIPSDLFNSDASSVPYFTMQGTASSTDLIDSVTMLPTTVSEALTTAAQYGPNGASTFANQGDAYLFSSGYLTSYQNDSPTTLTLTGLDPTLSYSLLFYFRNAQPGDGSSGVAINLGSTTYYVKIGGDELTSYIRGTNTDSASKETVSNYVEFDGLTGSTTQTLTIPTFTGGLTADGFQLAGYLPIPEPCTFALLGAGAVAFGAARFLRRKQA